MESGAELGPYEIVREIGSGGFGSVLLGRHRGSGEEVAIKTVTVPSEHRVASLRREIQALERIRHPGVVRILDSGLTAHGPWYAMELVMGTTLDRFARGVDDSGSFGRGANLASTDVLAAALVATARFGSRTGNGLRGGGAMPPPAPANARTRIFGTVRRLCAPLAYLHGEGIVHRDLKPENVLVKPDGTPVIVDFGLTSEAFDAELRERLEVVGDVSGTAYYMAPEQAMGELLDARADLYALGCILYELLTGRPPFVADTAGQVLLMHVHALPVPPSSLCRDLDPGVDEMILRLLAKDPGQRLGHAHDVAAALVRYGAPDEPLAGPAPRSYLYRPTLTGRHGLLESLDASIDELSLGRGGIVLLGGETGAGKTRFLKEAARRASQIDVRIAASECAPGRDSGALLGGFRGVFHAAVDRCRERGPGEAERILGARAAILAPYDAGVDELSRGLGQDAPAPLSPDEGRLRLFRALGESLVALAGAGGMCVLIDDLHHGDELTLAALRHFAQAGLFRDMPVLVIASHAIDDPPPDVGLMRRIEGTRALVLDSLDDGAIASVAADMLALHPLPLPFHQFLASSSGGNPFFVSQYLRTAVAEGALSRDASGRWAMRRRDGEQYRALEEAIPLPATLRELALRRLATLSAGARRVLDAACVLGREVDRALLSGIAGGDARSIAEGVDELVRRHCVEEAERGLVFRHATLREAAYDTIAAPEVARLHRLAAESLEKSLAGDDDGAAVLARHWDRAGDADRAIARYDAAARAARRWYAYEDAERHLRAILRLAVVPDARSLSARGLLAHVLLLRGRAAEALSEHEREMEEARAMGDTIAEAAAMTDLAGVEHLLGRVELACRRYEAGIAIFRARGEEQLEANAIGNLATVRQNLGQWAAADMLQTQALATHRRLGNVRGQLRSMTNLGGLRSEQGRWGEAVAIMEEGLLLAVESGEKESEGQLAGNIAGIEHARGRLPAARKGYERARDTFVGIGARASEGIAHANLAQVALEQGRLPDARERVALALGIAREVRALRLLAFARIVEGWILEAEGRLQDARAAQRDALRLVEGKSPLLESIARRSIAEIDGAEGDLDGALAEPRARRRLSRGHASRWPRRELDVARARVLRRAGRPAVELLDRAEGEARSLGAVLVLVKVLVRARHRAAGAEDPARPRRGQRAPRGSRDRGGEPSAAGSTSSARHAPYPGAKPRRTANPTRTSRSAEPWPVPWLPGGPIVKHRFKFEGARVGRFTRGLSSPPAAWYASRAR
ncbi:MAG: protein kinase [Acidobacteriota bacterium]